MNLLVIAGAVSDYSWELFEELRDRGVRVRIVSLVPAPSLSFAHEHFRREGVPSLDASSASWTDTAVFLQPELSDAILLLGTTNRFAGLLSLIRRRRSTPVLYVSDTNAAALPGAGIRSVMRRAGYALLARVCTEAWTLGASNDDATRLLGFRRRRHLPYYAVNVETLRAGFRPHAAAACHIRLLAIARLVPQKNLRALIRAVGDPTLREFFDLTCVGEGPERADLEFTISAVGGDNIRLLGARPRDALGAIFSGADALVIPSLAEPWGIVVVEALLLGLPVVATPQVGAATSLSLSGGGIVLAENGSEAGLIAALRKLRQNFANYQLQARARQGPLEREFSIPAVATSMVEALNSLRAELGSPKGSS